ncbi:MAG: hypothetical protein ACOYBP_00195 [Microbacteriaceae bacterium]
MAKLRKLAAIGAAAGTALAVSFAASPAMAAGDPDFNTPGWDWFGTDHASVINEVNPYFEDFLGSGLDIAGWTNTPFDGMFDLGDGTPNRVYFNDNAMDEVPLTQDSWTINDDDSLTVVSHGDFTDGAGSPSTGTLTVTLTIKGSFAKYSYKLTNLAGSNGVDHITSYGTLKNNDTLWTATSAANGWVSSDSVAWSSVTGWLTSDATDVHLTGAPNDEDVQLDVQASAAIANDAWVTVGVEESDLCSYEQAIADMVDMTPDFENLYGTDIPPAYSTECLFADPDFIMPKMTAGVAVDFTIPITYDPLLSDFVQNAPL